MADDYTSDLDTNTGPPPAAQAQPAAPAQPYESDLEHPDFGKPPPKEPAPSWSEVPMKALSNVPKSALGVGESLVQPIIHPIETAKSVGNLGMGILQKAGAPVDESYGKYADAFGHAILERYGSEENLRRTLAEDPMGALADLSMVFSGGETALARAPGMLGKIGEAAGTTARVLDPVATAATAGVNKLTGLGRDIEPATKELLKRADDDYKTMRGLGVEIHPQSTANLADSITNYLESARGGGHRDYLAPKTFKALDELRKPAGYPVKIDDIESVRKALNNAAADKPERAAARKAINEIDGYLATLPANHVITGAHLTDALNDAAKSARGNYAAAMRSEELDKAARKAERQSARAGANTNYDNALRQRVSSIIDKIDEGKRRGYTKEEVAALEKVVKGGPELLRKLSKYSPNGPVSTGLSMGAGFAAAGPLGSVLLPGVGYAARKASEALSQHRFNQASRLIRGRSPLGAERLANPPIGSGRTSLLPAQALEQTGKLDQDTPERLYISPQRARGGKVDRAMRIMKRGRSANS